MIFRMSLVALVIGLFAGLVQADLITIDADDGIGGTFSATSPSIRDVSEDLVRNQGTFAPLVGTAFTATMRYAGLNNFISYSQNAAGTSATLTFATGASRIFSAVDRDDLYRQIEDYLEDEGASEFARALELVNKTSTIAVTDGNPASTTAIMHRGAYRRYGFAAPGASVGMLARPDRVSWGEARAGDNGFTDGRWIVGYNPHYTRILADDGNGHMAGFDLSAGTRGDGNSALVFSGSMHYANIQGSDIVHAVFEIATPITLVTPTPENRILWELTPYVQMGMGSSGDLLAGGLLPGGGVVSGLHFEAGDWLISVANQIGHSDSLKIELDDGEFDPNISQQLVSHGIRGTTAISDTSWFFMGTTYHDYLQTAGVGQWLSPEFGFQWTAGPSSFSVQYRADLANDYKAHNISFGFGEDF